MSELDIKEEESYWEEFFDKLEWEEAWKNLDTNMDFESWRFWKYHYIETGDSSE